LIIILLVEKLDPLSGYTFVPSVIVAGFAVPVEGHSGGAAAHFSAGKRNGLISL